ncbi:MAG: calcium-translocating P-type ATPase, PMCA-type [Clostridia bacterium]|nr:calcium-translocating P-type ATPase, PMCA-type [Clostridia bacterium]
MKHYHNISIEQVIQALKTDIKNGLTSNEAKKRLEQNGANIISEKKKKSIIVRFFLQFNDFMILLLIGAAIISYITSIISKKPDIIEPLIILAIVIINAILGTAQESKAQKSIDALKKLSAPKARVLRNGKEITIDSSQIVCGDILIFNTGDIVCADCRLIESNSLLLGEASLTGEAVPRSKNADKVLPEFTPLGDRINMVFSSTGVVGGNGRGVVVKTGMATEVGEIASMLLTEDAPQTPLQKRLNNTGKVLGTSALLICVAIFIIGIFSHLDPLDMFMTSVSLAVAAIPEGLPAIVTIMLAIGVVKMSGKNAIVRTLPSVETLGSASVICTDKTGTLTKNEMKVTTHYSDDTQTLLNLCALCSSKNTNPTDMAIFTWATENIKDIDTHIKKHKIIKEIPFSSDSKKMSILCSYLGKNKIITKGAVEYILPLCTSVLKGKKAMPLSPQERKTILNRNENMTSNALRVIAVAYCDTTSNEIKEENMVFVGLIGIEDPPRAEARDAVLKCKNAGIIPVMITGDNVGTAVSIAKKTGILDNDGVMVGSEIDKLSDDELKKCVRKYRVFARVSPTHKVRIVKAWQSNGAVVAMTGDGVNDAPALSNADIGCSMGKSGTEVAKNASDIILTDDNFATIVGAVEVGRSIFDNIKKSVKFLLSSNIGEILTVFSGIVFGYSSPLNAISLLWVNLVTDSLPAIALGLDPDDDNIMSRPPNNAKNSLFSVSMWRDIILQGLMIGALSLLAFSIGTNVFGNILVGRTMAFAVLSISQLVHAFNMRSETSVIKAGLFKNKYLILSFLVGVILEVGVISIEPVARIFDITPLSPIQWIISAILSLMPLLIVETGKILEKKD